ncbi:hypothetical protein C1H46_025763 [Malus baccata]|uniref:Uncharacterized protein n=1 Tax=Malus baccata TaxID=106549 RepID=A0A540LQV3_MALBA|nr:hypothetical protein C1H46_025763 [Malus baccata]
MHVAVGGLMISNLVYIHMEDSNLLGIMRKGAWTQQEDDILRQYVEKHGDGKWHQVPRETDAGKAADRGG